jgi:universal stress protein A
MAIKRIACCTDFSENADAAFEAAVDLAKRYEAKLFIIHVLPPVISPLMTDAEWVMPETPQESVVVGLEQRMQERYGARIDPSVPSELLVLHGHVSTEVLRFLDEQQVDLVVLGSYGLSGMGLVFFGSVAKRVSQKAGCSVLIVRKPGGTNAAGGSD